MKGIGFQRFFYFLTILTRQKRYTLLQYKYEEKEERMATLLNPTIEVIEENPEVKSFIYQNISEFEPYITPETVITVVARDPKKLALQYETDGVEFDPDELKKMYRIAISLKEGDSKIEAEAVHKDIYMAISMAKDNLMRKLVAIHDSVVSQQDRIVEINHFLQNPVLH